MADCFATKAWKVLRDPSQTPSMLRPGPSTTGSRPGLGRSLAFGLLRPGVRPRLAAPARRRPAVDRAAPPPRTARRRRVSLVGQASSSAADDAGFGSANRSEDAALRAPVDAPPPQSKDVQRARFLAVRLRAFVAIFVGYSSYAVMRSTFPYISPMAGAELGLSLQALGITASVFPIMYGFSKLLTGVLADRRSPRFVLGTGLALAGAANMGLSTSKSLVALSTWWAVNGAVQGIGAGACAKMLTSWYSSEERGFWWALWSTSANVGGFLAPFIVGRLARSAGWRVSAALPGAAAVFIAVLVTLLARDSPQRANVTDSSIEGEETQPKPTDVAPSQSWTRVFFESVVLNRRIWLLAAGYFFVYFARSGLRSWLHFFLMDSRNLQASDAAYRVSSLEIGGLLGTFSSGVLSDRMKGQRVPVIVGYLCTLLVALALTWCSPAKATPWLDIALVSMLGFAINGAQCLVGLVGAEIVDRRTVATAAGFLGWISYGGAVASGYPTTLAIRRFGWQAYFVTLMGSTVLSAIFMLPLWKVRGQGHQKPKQVVSSSPSAK